MRLLRARIGRSLCLTVAACTAPESIPSPPPTETIAIQVNEGTALGFDLSPDGRTIVFDLLGQLWEIPSDGGQARPLTNAVADTAEDLDPSYSPDGRRIVFRGERRGRTGLWLLERGGGAPRQLTQLQNPDGYDGNAAWSPDGKSILFVRRLPPDSARPEWRTRLAALEVSTAQARELPTARVVGRDVRDPGWEPGGRRMALVAGVPLSRPGGRLWLVDAETGAATSPARDKLLALAPAFAPDGRRLAFFAQDSLDRTQLWLLPMDAPGATPVRLTSQADVTPTRVRWTPDGRELVYGAEGRLWRIPAAGGAPSEIRFTARLSFQRPRRTLPPPHFPEPGKPQPVRAFMGLALSPDAKTVAMLALGKLWLMPVGGAPRAVCAVPLTAHHLAWSADGAALAWSAGPWWREDLYSTDLATGSTRQITALPGREEHPAYSPDGRRLAFLYQPSEDTTILRIVDARGGIVSDRKQGRSLKIENGAEALWSPRSDELLYVSGGFSPEDSTKTAMIQASGRRKVVTGMPDSPQFPQWTANSIVFVRHSRLWRAPFDTTSVVGSAEPLGAEPAIYASASSDGTVLFLSAGGLRLRAPDGRERRLGWPLSYTPPVPASVLIRNGRIIDGTGRPATPPRDVLIQHGRISRIAAAGSLQPGAAEVVDAGGRFLIPGLMDLHAHEYRPELLPGYAYFGVTTIRDQGSPIGPLVATADAIAAGLLEGPRVDYGGFQFYSDWAYDTEDGLGVEPEADSGHLVRTVMLAQAFGSQHIKTRTFRRWDINARFVAEAHRRGMRVTGHCVHQLPLVAAGIDAKEHAGFCSPRSDGLIYDDLIQLYHAAGIAVVPTISLSSFALRMNQHPQVLEEDPDLAPFVPPRSDFGWMLQLDEAGRRKYAGYERTARQVTAALSRAGVAIGAGTDIWQIPTGIHLELQDLVEAGLSPLEAIQAATGTAARIIGAEMDFGTIEVGKWADLVILDENPLADIRNTRRIRAVMQAGRLVDRPAVLARFRH